jgi:DNA polymerase III delta prime subunit
MNGLTPNCIDDFIFSNPDERDLLKMILARKLPFPLGGKTGILLHGIWGTGKTTLAQLLPELIEVAYEGTWNTTQGVGQMPAPTTSHTQTKLFRCGGGLSSTVIKQTVAAINATTAIYHQSGHHYFVIDEMDRLNLGAQQSLRTTMNLKRCMFLCTTNNLSAIDQGIINRCHLIEMNQATNLSAYLPLASTILTSMGVAPTAVPTTSLTGHAKAARGSMRDFINSVVLTGIQQGGSLRL